MSQCSVGFTTTKYGGLGVGGGGGLGGGSGGCIRGIEGTIVGHIFKPLVTRLISITKETKVHDNYVSVSGSCYRH